MYQKALSGNILLQIENLHTPAKQYRAKIYEDNNFRGSVIFIPDELTGDITLTLAMELARKTNHSRIINLIKEIRLAVEEMYVSQPIHKSEPEIFMVDLVQQLEQFDNYLLMCINNQIEWEQTESYAKFIELAQGNHRLWGVLDLLFMTCDQNIGKE